MRKANLNFLVDGVAFAAFVFLAATGVLVRWVLPPGSGHFTTLWGMDRHEWGHVHFWTAVALLAALALHLFLHWRWILHMVKGRPRQGSGIRVALAVVGIIGLAGLAAAPFFGPLEQSGEPPHRLRSADASEEPAFQIDGSMTLRDIEQRTGVSAETILGDLGLPLDVPVDERLGRLRREHGFEVHDVRDVVRRRLEEQ
jgi:hypothetical protein